VRRIKHQNAILQYGAILFTAFVFGSSMSVVVTAVWPNAADAVQTAAILIAIAFTLVVVWLA